MARQIISSISAEIGARLRVVREFYGLMQSEVSQALGVGVATVSRYETGQREMEYACLIRFVLAYQITCDWILLGDLRGLESDHLRRHLLREHPFLVRTRPMPQPANDAAAVEYARVPAAAGRSPDVPE